MNNGSSLRMSPSMIYVTILLIARVLLAGRWKKLPCMPVIKPKMARLPLPPLYDIRYPAGRR